MNELFAKLKRLFEPRPRPAETIGEATSDRPPPPAAEPSRAEPGRTEPPPVEAAPSRAPASIAIDDLSEVRAALEAVAETPVTTYELEAQAPVTDDEPKAAVLFPVSAPTPTPATASSIPLAPTPVPPTEETVEASGLVPGRVGDALVLTLGTPLTMFTVAKASATLGRGQENSIRLDDLSVSRRHARIAYRQGGYWLSDLGSMGGTWVNGARLNAPRRIASGEVIDIGLCRLTVSFTGGAAKSPTKKSTSKPESEVATQLKRRR